MKKINVSLLAIAMTVVSTACNSTIEGATEGGGHEMHSHEGHEHAEDEATPAETMTETALDKATVKSITGDYLNLQQALANDDGEAAKASAARMQEALTGTDDALGKKLLFDAEHISGTSDLSHQRDHFEVLSKNVVALNSQVKTDQSLYIIHCPMAFGGKGADWVSNSEEVKNPYFGSEMLNCGRVQKKIR